MSYVSNYLIVFQLILINHYKILSLFILFSAFLKIEEWLKDIKCDWNHLHNIEEFEILKTHVAMGNCYTNIYLSKK